MNIEKRILIENMPGVYAAGSTVLDDGDYFIAASEERGGRVVLINADTCEIHEIQGGSGGAMSVIPSVRQNRLLSIEEFYPVFQAPASKIIEISLEKKNGKWAAASRKTVAEVPYLHRIGLLKEPDGYFIAAGKLCRKKDFSDDWSSAGFLEMIGYDGEEMTGREEIPGDIFKHHAMLTEPSGEGDIVYYGGTEGLFRTRRENGRWVTDRMLDVPTSDIVYTDLDGDGERELAVIEEFHGDKAVVFKRSGEGFSRVWEYPLEMGHVLWGGMLAGKMSLAAGSRRGGKELDILRFANESGTFTLTEKITIDRDGGPSQIAVRELGDRAGILAANCAKGELALYTLIP